ncbi:hybrid sensor histidine kinase/response regulator [Ruegeria arenilitoris]|uniref:hybrid sensor histidine kinase/response regulator n=1 Tax=Ruegeria arenilitoris TaxID=1173585 RepID=UPI00147CB4FE|nr:ATP-binding protein [Ruegeria arenilitoris]
MTEVAQFTPSLTGRHFPSWSRAISLVGVALLLVILAQLFPISPQLVSGLLAVGGSFLAVGAFVLLRGWFSYRVDKQAQTILASFLEKEPAPGFITDANGRVLIVNSAARDRFNASTGARLDMCLRSVFANPAAILVRMQSLAQVEGRAAEDIVTKGTTIPVLAIDLGDDLYLWRIKASGRQPWASASLPIVTLGRNDVVLNMNAAAEAMLRGSEVGAAEALTPEVISGETVLRLPAQEGSRRVFVCEVQKTSAGRDIALVVLDDAPADQWTTTFADVPVPMMHLAPGGEILDANRLARKLIGDVELGQTNIDTILSGLGHPLRDWLLQVAACDGPPRSEFLRLGGKDREVFVQLTLTRIVKNGEVRLVAVLNDATELKTLEAQFVQGQKMQAVGQLAGGVAHDFNNLLTAISGHCDLLLLRHDQSDPNYGDLVQINQNANRAAALVSQLLAFSRKQTLRPEVLDLRDTISDLIHLLNRLVGEKVKLILSHDPVLKPVRADKRQLEQVIMNLVVNARDAMPDGGEIRIETEVFSLTEPLMRDRATVPVGEYVSVKVIDSGVGIPSDKLQKIFEPFYTTKRTGEGTGLGLSTVYGIVKQTGGFIFVDSTEGRGTEFNVMLPVCLARDTEVAIEPPAQPEPNAHQGEGVVLLVEDEAPVRAFATRALRLKGYTVFEAGSAEDALRILADQNLHVDVFVTDVVMSGMDGPTWVAKALESRPDVRVVFMSGYTEGAFGDAGPEIRHSTFLPKPFSLTQLTEAVFQHLN